MSNSKGIIYIATGEKFIREAEISAKSVREHMPDISITLMVDKNIKSEYFDNVIKIENPRHDFGDQVFHLERAPYKKNIFLDSDIYLDESIEDLFDLLDQFDLAACQNQTNYASDRVDISEVNNIPSSFPEYNSGVVVFNKNEDVDNFLSDWRKIYSKVLEQGQIHNQAAFRSALYNSDLRIATLPQKYNCRFRNPGCVNGKVKVFHGRLIETGGFGANKTLDVEEAVKELNDCNHLRIYHTISRKIEIIKPGIAKKFYFAIKSYGFKETLIKCFKKLSSMII